MRKINEILSNRVGTTIEISAVVLASLFIICKTGQEYHDSLIQNTGISAETISSGSVAAKYYAGIALLAIAWSVILFTLIVIVVRWQKIALLEQKLCLLRNRLGWLRWLAAIIVLLAPLYILQYTQWGTFFPGPYLRILFLIGAALVISALITSRQSKTLISLPSLTISLLLLASVLIFGGLIRDVTDHPFSLTWSEGNRLWDYSVLFGRRLYNYPPDKKIFTYIGLGRQSLGGLPFLFSNVSIGVMRLWVSLTFSMPYAIFGWIAFQRRNKTGETFPVFLWVLSGLWAFVFLSQGPIYAPLVVCAILVAIAWQIMSKKKPLWLALLALLLIVIAGYLANASRFTWIFAPSMWIAMLQVGDISFFDRKDSKKKWGLAFAGIFAGMLGSYVLPRLNKWLQIFNSAQSQAVVTNSGASDVDLVSVEGIQSAVSRQALMWDRLWPNPTYGPGILLALAFATLPLILVLIYLVRVRKWNINWFQAGVILIALALFLGVGVVVSVKIGGGSNLHNMDMFLLGLAFAAAMAWVTGGRQFLTQLGNEPRWIQVLFVLMMGIMAYQPLMSISPLTLPADTEVQKALQVIQKEVRNAQENGEVLFMDQRQLLTFGYVQDVPLVPDYEKKYLMDKAMSRDQAYFSRFFQDLAEARFSLIITEPLKVKRQAGEDDFRKENNLWVKWVSIPVLCYYEPIATFREVKVQLLVPKQNPQNCPLEP